jgi:Flp pilus assembly pilin Flp
MQYASLVRRFVADKDATTSIEYAIMASCIAVAIVGVVVAVGSDVRDNLFQKISDAYPGGPAPTP